MCKHVVIVTFFIVTCLMPLRAFSQPSGEVVEMMGVAGGINWSKSTVSAEGAGVAPENIKAKSQAGMLACRAAVVDAQRNLLEITKGVRVQGETVVENMMLVSDVVRTTVTGVIQGAMVKSKKLADDGSCVVVMEILMTGKLASDIYKEVLNTRVSLLDKYLKAGLQRIYAFLVKDAYANETAWRKEIDSINKRLERIEQQLQIDTVRTRAIAKGDPTGVIVDARGLGFKPSMTPRFFDEKGNQLYPDADNQNIAKKEGRMLALFMNNLVSAQNHPRIGNRPLVLKASKTHPKSKTDIVLSKDATEQLTEAMKKGINNAEVIVVID